MANCRTIRDHINMLKLLLCIAAIIALAAGAAINNDEQVIVPRLSDNRIVGGTEVPITVHPHQITMRYKGIINPQNVYTHRCGGSIIAEDIIATAAHCIIGTTPSQFQIVAGTNYRQGGDGFIAPVKEIFMHEQYNPSTFNNDIALMILATPLPLNNITIKAIELSTENPREGDRATISGWGSTQEGGYSSNRLQEVHVPIVSNEVCNRDYNGGIEDSMLCAGYRGVGGKDACQGDSGGPLVIDGKLAGVVSWGYGCARPQYPGVYAKVSYLLPWIRGKIELYRKQYL